MGVNRSMVCRWTRKQFVVDAAAGQLEAKELETVARDNKGKTIHWVCSRQALPSWHPDCLWKPGIGFSTNSESRCAGYKLRSSVIYGHCFRCVFGLPLTNNSQTIHKQLTNNSQTTHKQLTNNSQTTHKQLTNNSQTTHKQLTNNSQTTHKQLTNNSQTTHKQLTNNSQTTHKQLTNNSQTTHKQLTTTHNNSQQLTTNNT